MVSFVLFSFSVSQPSEDHSVSLPVETLYPK